MALIQNRIVNGGFEAGLSSWNVQNVTIVNSPTNEGSSAARLEGGALNSFLIQSVSASPGDNLELILSLIKRNQRNNADNKRKCCLLWRREYFSRLWTG